MRVLLDANVLISYLLSTRETSPIRTVVRAAISGTYTLLLHDEITREIIQKVETKPYLADRIMRDEVEALFGLLQQVAETMPTIIEEIPPVSRDPKDDYLLAYGLVAGADYLVTGDEDLLTLGDVEGLTIVSPREFVTLLGNYEAG